MTALLVVWAIYLTFWGLLHALAVRIDGKGIGSWLARMAAMVVVGLIITGFVYFM